MIRPRRADMPHGIIPVGAPPAEYSPEYLPDGQVWVLKNGERLRLVRNYQEFVVAAQMHGGYADVRFIEYSAEWPSAPFTWEDAPPKYDPPAKVALGYRVQFRFGWPLLTVLVSLDYAIWRLWQVVEKSRHALFIQQFDPVSSWFEEWLGASDILRLGDVRYISTRDLAHRIESLRTLIKQTGG